MDDQTADFFNPPSEDAPAPPPAEGEAILLGPPADDEPILMGPPPTEDDAAPDFAAPPADSGFIGDVDEGSPDANPPAVLVPEPPAEETAFAAPPPETAGEEPFEAGAAAEDSLLPEPEPEEKGPSPMQKWNDEWQVTLKERKDAENAAKAEAVEAARVELEKFQAERDARRETRMAKNRADEQDKLEAIEADLENDNSWQRVVKLVELTHDTVEGAADVHRMRDVMITLKNEPARATVLTN
uniref:Clathrin light chain n=1 Tax=Pseudictyota dubia TaxID=2749911 RepID=A0A7R9VTD9_9STRA